MQNKDWWYLIATVLSPFAAAFLTLAWQKRKEKRDLKARVFGILMAHRKASPFPSEAVGALNLIDVVFYNEEKITRLWHELYDLYTKKPYPFTEVNHKILDLLSAIAKHLGYPNIQQTQMDRWYSPTGKPEGIKVSGPEALAGVKRKHEVFGYVSPEHHDVQVLVLSEDKKWHPQGPVMRDGPLWKVVCAFGEDHTASGQDYQIIALASAEQVLQPVRDLPPAVRSPIVPVSRI
jgi:hypothetical protein